ncbi:CRE-SRT-23 protein [Aphelenchoides avenae]|nr:CRE-SRT-23 protein [Aphelenchus avenae]
MSGNVVARLGTKSLRKEYAALWLILPSILALYYTFFTKPILFSGIYVSWFFNPHIGYANGGNRYESIWHTVHNYGLLCSLVGIYVVFILVFYAKLRSVDPQHRRPSTQAKAFLQVLLISVVNANAAGIYVYMQYSQLSEAVIIFGQFCWLSAHGMSIR